MAKLLTEESNTDKFDKKHGLELSLREIQLIHDVLWSIAYSQVAEDSDYKDKVVDVLYKTNDLGKLCNDFRDIVSELEGYISDFELF